MTELFKPNELISIVGEMALSRTARHLFNYFLQHAQVLIKFENFKGNTFEINYRDLNELACINHKNNKLISKVLDTLMKPVTLVDDPKHIIKVVPIYEVNVDIDKGVYRYKLAETIIELLRQTDYFTKLKLLEMNPLESKHSLVIYEFLHFLIESNEDTKVHEHNANTMILLLYIFQKLLLHGQQQNFRMPIEFLFLFLMYIVLHL